MKEAEQSRDDATHADGCGTASGMPRWTGENSPAPATTVAHPEDPEIGVKSPESAPPRPTVPHRDGLALALVAFALYSLLGQHTLYGVDAHVFLLKSHFHDLAHKYHVFYLPLLEQLKWLLRPLHLSLHDTARLFSALGTALGVWFAHLSCRQLALPRNDAVFVTVLVALCPAVLFFATVVESPGPFFAFAGAALWLCARLATRVTLPRSLACGAGIGVLYLAHPTGALLLALLPAILSLGGGHRAGATVRPTLAAGVAALLVLGVVPPLLRQTGSLSDPGFALAYVESFLRGMGDHVLRLGPCALWEWLWPFAPISLLWLVALATPRCRVPAALLGLGLLPYLGVAAIILADGVHEGGAYLVVFAWPGALLAARLVRSATLRWVACIVAAAIGVGRVVQHDRPERARGYFDGVQALAAGHPFAVALGDHRDVEAFFLHFEHAPAIELVKVAGERATEFRRTLRWFDRQVRAALDAGCVVLVSAAAMRNLYEATQSGAWEFAPEPRVLVEVPAAQAGVLWVMLRDEFALEPVQSAGFTGFRLRKAKPPR